MRLIRRCISFCAAAGVIAASPVAVALNDWANQQPGSLYYSGNTNYKTPPSGGWEVVLEREMEQAKAKAKQASGQDTGIAAGGGAAPLTTAPAAGNCESPPSLPGDNFIYDVIPIWTGVVRLIHHLAN